MMQKMVGPESLSRLPRLVLFTCMFLALLLSSLTAYAATSSREARNTQYLTVCGDPNQLPFSNEALEGFENRVAQLIADELGRPLRYRWWPQTIGFVRNTLRVRMCDLVLGITSVNEMVQNTNPYYRSVYSLVYRSDAGLNIGSLKDPKLRELRIGVVAGTPPATLIARYDLIERTKPYLRTVDTRHYSPARQAIEDVAGGETDVAVIWGPIAGYFAPQQQVPLTVVPLPAKEDAVPLAFNVSMGIRHRETNWKHQLNDLLVKLAPQIESILLDYGIPLLDQQDRLITRQ